MAHLEVKPKSSKGRLWLIIAIVILIIAVAAFCYHKYYYDTASLYTPGNNKIVWFNAITPGRLIKC